MSLTGKKNNPVFPRWTRLGAPEVPIWYQNLTENYWSLVHHGSQEMLFLISDKESGAVTTGSVITTARGKAK